MAKERIQKIIAETGLASRRKAEEMIEKGRVKVNGRPIKLGDKADPHRDLITVDGEKLEISRKKQFYYVALNKPRGYVTTMSDELGRKCVADLVADVPAKVYPIGRLDKNSEGLLLLTNDGDFANLLMHPKHNITKTYRVTIRPDITDEHTAQFAEGIVIDGRKTAPVDVRVISKEPNRVVCEFVLREGRNRQIRKMCEALGLEVARLKRIIEGPVKLGFIQPGKWRYLTKEELSIFRTMANKALAQAKSKQKTFE